MARWEDEDRWRDPERRGEEAGRRRAHERGGDWRGEGDYTTYGSGAHFGTRGEFLGERSRRELRGPRAGWRDDPGDEERWWPGPPQRAAAPYRGRRGLEWRPEGRSEGDHGYGRHEFDDRAPLDRLGRQFRSGQSRGPKGYRRSDERIHEDVCERIARSGVDAGEVEVRVEGGEVILSGHVETRYGKRMLEDLAEDVFGVTDVQNQLRVTRAAEVPARDRGEEAPRDDDRDVRH